MKTIEQYLHDRSLDQVELARELAKRTEKSVEAAAVIISRIVKHKHRPSDEVIEALYLITNGEVTPNDYYDLPKLPKQPKQREAVA